MRTGIATVPLDYGRCPPWLFERMKRLARGITTAIIEELGADEFLRRLSNPIWFQSLGCVLAFDWNSSGLTTTTLGALKEGIRGLESELGIFVCGGKGKTSRKTPEQIQNWGEFLGWTPEKIEKLVYASKISAKVDSSALQDGFQIYHHNLIFARSGQWAVLQQGMNINFQKARRYHWLSNNLNQKQGKGKLDFVDEPHAGIASDIKVRPLNLTARLSENNREISSAIVREEPKTFMRQMERMENNAPNLKLPEQTYGRTNPDLVSLKKGLSSTSMELQNREFYWHPVLKEKFDLKRLEKTIFLAHEQKPADFETLLSLKGVGPKTIRALSLVAELIYGAKPSFEDPARYSFAHGGKDGTPYFPKPEEIDKTIAILEEGIKKSQISAVEKEKARQRLRANLV